MSKQPFMPLFFGDFLASTAEWSGEERALYLLMLSFQWSMGSLPTDIKRLAKLVDYERRVFEEHWPQVSKKFVEEDGRLYNLRLETHREKSRQIGELRASQGRNGGIKSGETRRRKAEAMASGLLEPNAKQEGSNSFGFAEAKSKHPSHPTPDKSKNSPDNSAPVRVLPPDHAHAHTHAFDERGPAGKQRQDFDDPELADAFTDIREHYPHKSGRLDWLGAEHHWRARLEEGVGLADLLAGVRRYRDYVAAGGVSGSQYVLGPERFFQSRDRLWAQPWNPPAANKPVPRIRTATDIAEEYEARAAGASP